MAQKNLSVIYRSRDGKFRNINDTLIFDRNGKVEKNEFFKLAEKDEFSHKFFNMCEACRDYVSPIDQHIENIERLTKSRWDYEIVFEVEISFEWDEFNWVYTPKNVTLELGSQVECKLICKARNGEVTSSGTLQADSMRYLEDALDEIASKISGQVIHRDACNSYEMCEVVEFLAEEEWCESETLKRFEENLPASYRVDLRLTSLTNNEIDWDDECLWDSLQGQYEVLIDKVVDYCREQELNVCVVSRKQKDIIVLPKVSSKGLKESIYYIDSVTQDELNRVADFIKTKARELVAEII